MWAVKLQPNENIDKGLKTILLRFTICLIVLNSTDIDKIKLIKSFQNTE